MLLNPTFFCSLTPSKTTSTPPILLLKFKPSPHQNLHYLKSIGVVSLHSKPPPPETLSHILSTVTFLKSKGFSDADFPRLSFLSPHLFSPTFDPSDIEPVFDFLTQELSATSEEAHGLIIRCPHLLESSVEYCLRPTLEFLQHLGLEKLNVPTTLNAHLLDTRVAKLKEKIKFLRSVGFTYEESARVCARFPAIFGYNVESNLRPKFGYLVKQMKREGVQEVNKFPQYFGFSLERRIVPRHLHLKQRNAEMPLNSMLLLSDKRFFAKWK